MIGKRLGDFEIQEEIGRGGMGQVYRARQISLDRDVAIKILPGNLSEVEEFRERFDIEAKAVASLVHENILQMYSKGVTDDGVHYFAMEYVDGEDLGNMLKKGATFSEGEAIGIAIQICRGLEAAWKKNIIHRDIKPSNIILTKSGTAKIADFGLAKSLDATKRLTQTNMYMGTVAYISPEQGEGKPLDHRTDIYSLGIVLYQLLTGSVPFKAETPSSVIYKHVYEVPPPPRTINPAISSAAEAVVLKAIAKKPEDRFQNPVEFREALESVNKAQPEKKGEVPKQAAVFAGQKEAAAPVAAAGPGNKVPIVILAAAIILLLGGSGLYASIYGYRALLSKVLPFTTQEDKQSEAVPQQAGGAVAPSSAETGGPSQEQAGPAGSNTPSSSSPEVAAIPPQSSLSKSKETGKAGDFVGRRRATSDARSIPPVQSQPAKRSAMPSVLVVTSGEPNIADIIESVIGKKLLARSFPLSASGEIQGLSERYGQHGIPLNALDRRRLKSDILVYASISTMDAAPLRFYGHTAEQYASTISIKVIDTATKKVIASPRSRTVNYTTLNMQDNIEEAIGEMTSDLPKKIEAFWKG
ncbi:MAG: protein kinase [Nitrospiraceae bacterium]|nr:protein kinase [Nitrospiraceae bacterium]